MAGVEDDDEFRDAAACPPPASPPSTPKPPAAVGGGGFGKRLLASIRLPATLSAAIGRSPSPSASKRDREPEPAPAPAAASKLGLGLLLHLGGKPPADHSPAPATAPDASPGRDLQLPPAGALQQRRGEEGLPEERAGPTARRALFAPRHGEDRVVGHDVGVGEVVVAPVPVEEEGRLAVDGREEGGVGGATNEDDFSLQDQEEEGEQLMGGDLDVGAALGDQEMVEEEGATVFYTAVEDQSDAAAEQGTGDAPGVIEDDSVVEEGEKAIEQGCAVGVLLGAAEDGVGVGLQEEEDVVVQGQREDAISVQDQHDVVEQCCTGDEAGAATGDSVVQDHDVVVVEQEGVTEYFDAVVEDQSNCAAVEQCASDELGAVKDVSLEEESEKAVEQECAIGILDAAEEDVAVGSQQEKEMVVKGQGEDAISAQDQLKVGEQCTADEVGVAMMDSAVQDQEVLAVEKDGVTESEYFDAAVEDQSNIAVVEQCTSDELRGVNDSNIVEEKEKTVEQEGAIGILGAAEDDVAGGSQQEEDMVVEGQGEDGVSVQNQHKVVEQCTDDQVGVAKVDSAVQDQEVLQVEQEGVTKYFDTAVEDQSNNAAVEQCTNAELGAINDGNSVEEMEMAIEQESAVGILGAADDDVAVGSQKEDVVVEGQVKDNIPVQDQHEVMEHCTDDELGVAMGDSAVQDQEVVVLEQEEPLTECFDAVVEDQSNNAAVEQCASDELIAVKDGNAVEEKDKVVVQDGAIGILGTSEDGVVVGLQEEGDMVVEGRSDDGMSVQGQHKVVEQCMVDELRVAMGDSAVQDQEVTVVVEEDQCSNSVVDNCTSGGLREVKDGNILEEKVKAVGQEGAIGIRATAVDHLAVNSQEEEVMVMAEQGDADISYQYKVAEQYTDDQLRTTPDQEVVEQERAIVERIATTDGIAVKTQENAGGQFAGDESRVTKDENTLLDKVVGQGVMNKQDAIKHASAVKSQEEENVVVVVQGWDDISVQEQDKEVEQCTSDQLRTTMVYSAVGDREVSREKVRFCVGYTQRPGKQNCRAYMTTGSCPYGLSCYLNHPQLKAKAEVSRFPSEQWNREVSQFLELNRVGLPIREGARNCTYYMRNRTCKYGKKCCFNHPDHVLDVQIYRPTGWDDTNLPSSPHSKKSSEHATMDDITASSDFLPPNTLQMSGWDDANLPSSPRDVANLPSSPHLKKSSEHATADGISSSSEFLPPNILQMLLPPQNVPPGPEEKGIKVKKDPDWASASDDSDGCSSDNSGGPLRKHGHHVDHSDGPGRTECPFLSRFGNCKFGSTCKYYHSKGKFPSRNHPKDLRLPEELMVYPDNPVEPECPFYMKTGSCKFGAQCKFHHPKNLAPSMQGPTAPERVITADEHHSAAITIPQDHMHQQQSYPERPGQPDCRYYMQFGKCKFLSACVFHHPKDRLPSGMPDCPFFMKTGRCQFGSSCEFRHPRGGEMGDGTDFGHNSFTKSENVLQQQEHTMYPERPGEPECAHYMKHGCCKFQMNCRFHHPADRLY